MSPSLSHAMTSSISQDIAQSMATSVVIRSYIPHNMVYKKYTVLLSSDIHLIQQEFEDSFGFEERNVR